MRRLISNKGNLLFTTAMCLVVAMIGFSLIALIAASNELSSKHDKELYRRYTYESYARIAVDEVINHLGASESCVQYSPLKDSSDIQLELQEALISSFITETGFWKYNDLLPASLSNTDVNINLEIQDFNTILEANLNLQCTQALKLPNIKLVVCIEDYIYYAELSGLRLIYTLDNNKVHCRYDTTDARLINTLLSTSNWR